MFDFDKTLIKLLLLLSRLLTIFFCHFEFSLKTADLTVPAACILPPIGTLSNDEDDGSENVAKKMNLRSFRHNRVFLDSLNMSNASDFSWS